MESEKIWLGVGKGHVSLHHAYLIAGDREKAINDIFLFLGQMESFSVKGNPDLYVERFDTFAMENAKKMKAFSDRKPFGNRRVFILAWNFATGEAQNSLLKILEEPASSTHYFIIVPNADTILPTLRSRLHFVKDQSAVDEESLAGARAFVGSSVPKRLSLVKDLVGEIKDETQSKQSAVSMIGAIEWLYWKNKGEMKSATAVFDEISLAKKYISDNSSSAKLIMEHLALVLPKAVL